MTNIQDLSTALDQLKIRIDTGLTFLTIDSMHERLASIRSDLFSVIENNSNDAVEAAKMLLRCDELKDRLTPRTSDFFKRASTSRSSDSENLVFAI